MAPFLLRSDERSEILVHIMDLEAKNGQKPLQIALIEPF